MNGCLKCNQPCNLSAGEGKSLAASSDTEPSLAVQTPLTGEEELEKYLSSEMCNKIHPDGTFHVTPELMQMFAEQVVCLAKSRAKNKELTDKLKEAESTFEWALKGNPSSKQKLWFESTLKSIRSSPPESAEQSEPLSPQVHE